MRIRLRPVEDDDVALFYEHQRDSEAADMAAFPSRSREDHAAHWDKIRADDSNVMRTIVWADDVAGNIVSWRHEDGHREVGYWIDKRLWGRGIASRALRAFLDIEQTRPLYAFVAERNGGSIRVLEKCGFVPLRTETEDDQTHLMMVLE